MKRMDAAVAMLEVLDRRRAEVKDRRIGERIERDLVDLYIRDLDPERYNPAGMNAGRWLLLIGFLAGGLGQYAVLFWLLWPER
jgi:hypothetical protein